MFFVYDFWELNPVQPLSSS